MAARDAGKALGQAWEAIRDRWRQLVDSLAVQPPMVPVPVPVEGRRRQS